MTQESLSLALNDLAERHIRDTLVFSPGSAQAFPERISHMKKKRILTFALAAALILLLGAAAYALSGIPRSVGSYSMPQTAEYTSLSELSRVEKTVGYPVTVPERFSNGYAFAGLSVNGQAVFGEDLEVLKEYYGVHVNYSRNGAPELYLDLSPVLDLEGGGKAPAPSEQRTVDGVTVNLNRDRYKLVPENYEKTADDLAREAAGHFYISFGSGKIEEREIVSAAFTLEGVNYLLMDMAAGAGSLETLTEMAAELIRAAG